MNTIDSTGSIDNENIEQGADFNKDEPIETKAGEDIADANAPLSTQGTDEEREENMGGTMNLSLEQLKKEGDAGA